jgi:putative transposase
MARLSAVLITVSETEKADLERLLRRSSTPQQIALRAKIILRASSGEGHGDISRGSRHH